MMLGISVMAVLEHSVGLCTGILSLLKISVGSFCYFSNRVKSQEKCSSVGHLILHN